MALEEEELRSNEITAERLAELAATHPFQVASHRNAPPELLARLATSADEMARWQVARRKTVPVETLVALTRDPAARVRIAALQNARLPPDARAPAVADPDAEVRAGLAATRCDEASFRALAADPSPEVRAAVVANAEAPADLLSALARDPDESVRIAVASAEHAPPELVAGLASDPSSEVLAAVAARELAEDVLRTLAAHPDGAVRLAVADNPDTPAEVLAGLARDPSEEVRHAIVWRDATTEATLDVLARDPAERVREAVARQGRCGLAALAALASDPAPVVRAAAAKDPRRPEEPARYTEPAQPVARVEAGPYVEGSRSTIGGPAWLPQGVPWPACALCHEPLALFVQVRLEGVPDWVPPGSQLAVFACRRHDDVPTAAPPGELLPRDAWERTEGHVHVRLDPPSATLAPVPPPAPGLRPATLVLAEGPEEIREVGPRSASSFVGSRGFEVGGVPSWAHDREDRRCWCGAQMRLVLQVPADHRFAVDGADREIPLFLGNELYVLACTAQCDPRAVWPIVQG